MSGGVTNVPSLSFRKLGLPSTLLVVFCAQLLMTPDVRGDMVDVVALHTGERLMLRPWTVLTYGFVHGSVVHFATTILLLLFLMFLFEYDRWFSEWIAFSVGTVVGGLMFIFLSPVWVPEGSTLVGASAGVCAIVPSAIVSLHHDPRMSLFRCVLLIVPLLFILLADVLGLCYESNWGILSHVGGYLGGGIYALIVYMIRRRSEYIAEEQRNVFFEGLVSKVNNSGYGSLTDDERTIIKSRGDNLPVNERER